MAERRSLAEGEQATTKTLRHGDLGELNMGSFFGPDSASALVFADMDVWLAAHPCLCGDHPDADGLCYCPWTHDHGCPAVESHLADDCSCSDDEDCEDTDG